MSIVNATPVPVEFRDGSKDTVTLGELSLRQLYVFIKHLGAEDTPALVAFCAAKPIEWVDTLKDESFDALSKKAIELNFRRAVARTENDPIAAKTLAPLLMGLARSAKGLGTDGTSGSSSLAALAVSESVAATGNASST